MRHACVPPQWVCHIDRGEPIAEFTLETFVDASDLVAVVGVGGAPDAQTARDETWSASVVEALHPHDTPGGVLVRIPRDWVRPKRKHLAILRVEADGRYGVSLLPTTFDTVATRGEDPRLALVRSIVNYRDRPDVALASHLQVLIDALVAPVRSPRSLARDAADSLARHPELLAHVSAAEVDRMFGVLREPFTNRCDVGAVVHVVGRLASSTVVSRLLDVLRTCEHRCVVRWISLALRWHSSPAVAHAIDQLARSAAPDARPHLLYALGWIDDPCVEPLLVEWLASDDVRLRIEAARGITALSALTHHDEPHRVCRGVRDPQRASRVLVDIWQRTPATAMHGEECYELAWALVAVATTEADALLDEICRSHRSPKLRESVELGLATRTRSHQRRCGYGRMDCCRPFR